jgi:hypothetical protein
MMILINLYALVQIDNINYVWQQAAGIHKKTISLQLTQDTVNGRSYEDSRATHAHLSESHHLLE